jgi:hypothetical protein
VSTEQTTEEAWHEVGRQFQALGESLATAVRAGWEREETRRHLQGMQAGLEAMVDQVGQVIQEISASPEAQQACTQAKRAAESARTAGEEALRDAQPHLLSALNRANAELQKIVSRLQES